ncbi:hypothetical protein ABT052_33680 [Streptomyces sp. NPDC002766]|jgi:hypothetical protein|uniref:hypothetical protein n=1 Tax=unclassified Streptomyces TaxID=2593676 RepID=UPI00331A0A7D
MENSGRPEWHHTLERCGLQVIQGDASRNVTPVQTAIYAVTGFEVEPESAIPIASPRAIDELDSEWHRLASQVSLYSETNEFLILPPISGGSKIGWVQVRDLVEGNRLPSRIASVTGSREFVAISLDGRHLCAISVEEDDYWVVVHDFDR